MLSRRKREGTSGHPWHYFYDVLVGLDFMTALGFSGEPRMRETLNHLVSNRLPNERWALNAPRGDMRLDVPGRASRMITFLALRVLKRTGRPPRHG